MQPLVFGPNGYVGKSFVDAFGYRGVETRIDDSHAVEAILDRYQPGCVINCAGRTGTPNVDACEADQLSVAQTYVSNVIGAKVLAHACVRRKIHFTHVSSGCIYDGPGVFQETDNPNFSGSWYSQTKIMAEAAINLPGVLIARPRMIFSGDDPHPRNLITKLGNYEKVLNVPNSMTYLPEFLNAVKWLMDQRSTGIFNLVNPGAVTPYEVARITHPKQGFLPIGMNELRPLIKTGRSNCVLSCRMALDAGCQLSPAGTVLRRLTR